jgi:hypothetical protein
MPSHLTKVNWYGMAIFPYTRKGLIKIEDAQNFSVPCSLISAPCSLLPVPCYLYPSACRLKRWA